LAISVTFLAVVLFLIWSAFASLANNGNDVGLIAALMRDSPPPDHAGALSAPASQHTTDWNLLLVNPWNSIPEGYEVTLAQLEDGHSVDARCAPDLQEMMDDLRAAGLSPLICSSYRTQEKQEQLFLNKVNALMSQGYAEADARAEAGKEIAAPGMSEHQTGLAVDIVEVDNQRLDSTQEHTAVQQWLTQNSWKYGFILRYPAGKSSITGIMYESWHYRYVGKQAAEYMYENGVCLEEYLEQL
jgi:D-alanyl-D-alanine carboxypeptidase